MKKHNSILVALAFLPGLSIANVVVNGTFDNNTAGWNGTYTAQPGGSSGFPIINTGSYYWGGGTASNSISQVYNLNASDLNTLSNEGINYTMSGDLFGYATQGDHSIFTASFYSGADAGGSLLGSIALDSATNDPGTWGGSFIAGNSPNFQSAAGALPSLSASILFNLESIRLVGSSNDGYADNLNFSVIPANVPLPAAAWLFGSGLLGLVGMRKK
jgi:hypothetical protein